MKKLLLLFILVLGLVSCGEKKVNITPKEEKVKIIQGYLNKEEDNIKKYNSIKQELQALADEGNDSAEKELGRWKEILDEEESKKWIEMTEKRKKMVEQARKTGKLWN